MSTPMMDPRTAVDDFGANLRADLDRWHPQGQDTGKEQRRALARWRRALCSSRGPDSTCRLTGLVLANYLLSEHDSAPSQARLAVQTGLTSKAVGQALRRLVTGHWLIQVSDKRPGRGARGMGYRYLSNIPQNVTTAERSHNRSSQLQQSNSSAKPARRDVETADSAPKSPQNVIPRDAVIGDSRC